jgi:uncharacterized protein YkwD
MKFSKKSALVLVVLVLINLLAVPALAKDKPEEKLQEQMLFLINSEREERGLTTLELDEELTKAALAHATDMIERDYFSHWTPEKLSPADRLRQAKIPFRIMGENLAGNTSVNHAHGMLMESPSHRDNILNEKFGKVGIGIIKGGRYGYMMVMIFKG